MTSNSFSPENIIDKVEVAYFYCSSIFGENITVSSGTVGTDAITVDDNQQGMAIALLADALLIEGRKTVQSRKDPTVVIRSTNELFTEEMRNMLMVADETDEEEVAEDVMWSDNRPTEHWDASNTGFVDL